MTSLLRFPFQDLRGQQRVQLARTLNDDACVAYAERDSNARFYGKHGAVAAVALGLLALLWSTEYGNPLSGPGWNHHVPILAYAALVAVLAHNVLPCVRRYRLAQRFGFQPGRYVLPFTIIDARTDTFVVTDLMQLAELKLVHHTSGGRYTRSSFTFSMKDGKLHLFTVVDKARAERFYERFHALQEETRQAFAVRDMDKLRLFDPLVEVRKNKWVLPPRSNDAKGPGLAQKLWSNHLAACAVLTIVLAPTLWALRTAASDVAMYQQTLALGSEAAYRGYLDRGRFHADEIRAALPRVSFNEVVKRNSVSALRELLSRYPNAGLQQDVAAAIHTQYERAMQRFESHAVSTDPALIDAMRELLAKVEARGNPAVPVRFDRPSTEQLAELDRSLAKRGAINGREIIPASSYFSEASASAREARIVSRLQNAFHLIFPNDVLTLVQGGHKPSSEPGLDIHYEIEPSGALYFMEKDEGRGFVGLLVRFDSALKTSDTAAPWRFKLAVQPPDQFRVEWKQSRDAALNPTKGPQAGQVYATMAERAFDSLENAMTAAVFRPKEDAAQKKGKAQAAPVQADAGAPALRNL